MENEQEELPELPGPATLPTRAADLFGISEISTEMMRGYLQEGMADELRHHFGINEDEARLTLRCADLATLPAWDAETMLEAATVWRTHANDMAARYGIEGTDDDVIGIESMRRRIRLAMLAERTPEVMRPPEALALLERAGIHVYFELRDAVVASLLKGERVTDEDVRLYRRLQGIKHEPQTDSPKSATATDAPRGVPKAAIIGAFKPPGDFTPETWENALGDAKRKAWLKSARVDSGKRGVSALWNPARLAMCICDQFGSTPMRRGGYGRIIEQHFPDWLPEWQEYADSFE